LPAPQQSTTLLVSKAKGGNERMLRMEQVKDIKYLRERKGLSYRAIIKETGHAFETVKKYADQDDFNIEPKPRKKRKSKLEPYLETIKTWIEQDLQAPRKQRHTAQRIYDRLKEIFGDTFDVSDRALRSKVAILRKEMNNNNDGYLPLEHPPGEAQADFGEAVFVENGKRYQGHYLTLSFPYSNVGYTQLTKGENQECLLTGLKDIFEYLQLVPDTIWFDNLSPAVKKIKKYGLRDKTQGFARFELHYGFKSNFCNPASGHEKGFVENKIGYHRRNFLVPVPQFGDMKAYNKELFKKADQDMNRLHYQKNMLISELFQQDQKAMHQLPQRALEVFKLQKARVDHYGKVAFDNHLYSTSPNYAGKQVWIKASADQVFVLDEGYRQIQDHPRLYGKQKESMKWIPYLELMSKRPTALKYTSFFQKLPQALQNYFESCQYQEKKAALKLLTRMIAHSDITTAQQAFEMTIKRGLTDIDSIWTTYYQMTVPERPLPDMVLGHHIPEIKPYEIDTASYDTLMKGDTHAVINPKALQNT